MKNAPEVTARIVREATVPDIYRRAQTAMAMSVSELWKLKGYLEQRAKALRAEADAIDKMLATASAQTDSWYENIIAERDEAFAHAERLIANAATTAPAAPIKY